MIYQAIENPSGKYKDKDGNCYDVIFCTKATGPAGVNIGWQSYKSLKSALKAFGLKEVTEEASE